MERRQPIPRTIATPSRIAFPVLALVAALGPAPASQALPVAGVAGADYSQVSKDQTTRSVLAGGVARVAGLEASLVGMRYDDSVVGVGTGVAGGLGLSVAPMASLQAQGERYLGDGDADSWRVKLGPRLDAPGGTRALLAWSHYEDNQSTRLDGGVLEVSTPVGHVVTARLNAAIANAHDQRQHAEGSTGLSWTAVPHIQLLGDVGVARNGGTSLVQPAPHGILGGLLSPPGNGGTTKQTNEISATARVGVRFLFP